MSYHSFDNIEIIGMSAAVPKERVLLDSFIPTFGEQVVAKFKSNVGINEFRRAKTGQTASDLGVAAAENLMERLDFDRNAVGVLVFVSLSFDYFRPATACVIQHRLELPVTCTAFDVGMGCSGFTYGLQIASALLQNSEAEYALIIASDTAGQLMYPKDQSTAMLIGDAGTATLIHKSAGHFVGGLLGTDGSLFSSAVVPAGAFRHRDVNKDSFKMDNGSERTNYHYYMNGVDIFSFATSDIPKAFTRYFELSCTTINEYDSVVLHQSNQMIINRLIKKLNAYALDAPISIDRYGNTSSASIPLTICDKYACAEEGTQKVISCGYGTGLSYGISSFDVDLSGVFGIIETDEIFEDGLIHDGT